MQITIDNITMALNQSKPVFSDKIASISIRSKNEIQIGDNTQIQDHVMTPTSFNTIKTTANTSARPKPEDLLSIYFLPFFYAMIQKIITSAIRKHNPAKKIP